MDGVLWFLGYPILIASDPRQPVVQGFKLLMRLAVHLWYYSFWFETAMAPTVNGGWFSLTVKTNYLLLIRPVFQLNNSVFPNDVTQYFRIWTERTDFSKSSTQLSLRYSCLLLGEISCFPSPTDPLLTPDPIFSRFFVSTFCSRTKFILHGLSGRNAVVLFVDVRARQTCKSRAKTPSLNNRKGWWWNGKHKMNTLYHLYATGNLNKGLFRVLLSHVEGIVYTYMYI